MSIQSAVGIPIAASIASVFPLGKILTNRTEIPNRGVLAKFVYLKSSSPPKVSKRITLTNAFVVKNAAFILLRSFGFTSVC